MPNIRKIKGIVKTFLRNYVVVFIPFYRHSIQFEVKWFSGIVCNMIQNVSNRQTFLKQKSYIDPNEEENVKYYLEGYIMIKFLPRNWFWRDATVTTTTHFQPHV